MKFRTILLFSCIIGLLLGMFVTSKQDYKTLQLDYDSYVSKTDSEIAELQYQLNIRPLTPTQYIGEFTLTYYDACVSCCGKSNGITASGAKACDGVTVAVDPSVIPLGTYIYIEGVGYRVAQDVGGAVEGNRIDVYVHSHEQALQLGVRKAKVWRMIG